MGYGPQIGTSHQGYPIYLYTDELTNLTSYVVVLPDGRAFHSDAQGRLAATPSEPDKQIGLALIGGLIGFAFGGAGAILGALIGAAAGGLLNKKGA
jgi:hypothetical protein